MDRSGWIQAPLLCVYVYSHGGRVYDCAHIISTFFGRATHYRES